jgi:hypothetical protein
MIQPPADLDDVTGYLAAILAELRGLRADIQQRQSSEAPHVIPPEVDIEARASKIIDLREPKPAPDPNEWRRPTPRGKKG